jgi:hypothetical protein
MMAFVEKRRPVFNGLGLHLLLLYVFTARGYLDVAAVKFYAYIAQLTKFVVSTSVVL